MPSDNCTQLKPRHILKLTVEEKRNFLDSFDQVFSDIDGVVWNLNQSLPGSPEGFQELQRHGKEVNFITNNAARRTEVLLKRFANVNLDVDADHVIYPSSSVVSYLQSIKFEGLIYFIGCELFKGVLRDAGYRIKDGPNKLIEESYLGLAGEIFAKEPEPIRAVIIDIDFNLNSIKLLKAQQYLKDPNCLFIAGATDKVLPLGNSVTIFGPGYFIDTLADATNRMPAVLGKPGKELSSIVLERYGIQDPKRALMIGDMLEQDIGFGKQSGFQTLAVLSGGTTMSDLQAQRNPKYTPDYYADSMADFLVFFEEL